MQPARASPSRRSRAVRRRAPPRSDRRSCEDLMMQKRRAGCLGLVALALVAMAAPALAQPQAGSAETAAAEFDAAQKLYDAGRQAEALPRFRKALEASKSPNARLMVARCLI